MSVAEIMMTLEILGDGKWHLTKELLLNLNLSENKFRELTSFLKTYRFIKVDKKNGRIKISSDFKKLLSIEQ